MRTAFRIYLFFLCMSCISTVTHGADAFPPPDLIGTWEGTSSYSRHGAHESTIVSVTIMPDGKVEGSAGGARFTQCTAQKNRGWLGKILNIKTDYIIRGYLEGPVAKDDAGGLREIAIPFNIRDGKLVGGLGALTQRWWECCPAWLFGRLSLPKKP